VDTRIQPSTRDASASLVQNRDYLLLTSAAAISSLGSKLTLFALPFLAIGLTNSPLVAGLLSAAQLLPYLLFSLLAGAWVDRADRRRLLVACDLVRAVLLTTIPIAAFSGMLSLAQLFVVVFVSGACTVVAEVADMAALPRVVAPGQLARARSVSEGIDATTSVLGPTLGGLLVGLGRTPLNGATLALLADALSYFVSAVALLGVRRQLQVEPSQERTSFGAAVREGLRFLWGKPTLRLLMLLTAAVNFVQAPTQLLVILTAQGRFGLAPSTIGALFGAAGIAAVAGSALASLWYRPERLGTILVAALAVWASSSALLAFAPGAWALAVGLALASFVWPVYAVAVVSYRLAETPDALQGRVISGFRTVSYGAEPLGLAAGGWLVAIISPQQMFLAMSLALVGCLMFVGWGMRRQRGQRRR
jgi:MFS family permease